MRNEDLRQLLWRVMMLSLLMVGAFPAGSPAAVVIVAEGEYVMGTGETMEVARERAKKAALQAAAEKAGAFVRSYTSVRNLVVESDVIEVVANHAMKVEILERKETDIRSPRGDLEAVRFYVRLRATLTDEEVGANLKKVRADQSIADAYARLQQDYEKQAEQFAKLKRQWEQALPGEKARLTQMISQEENKYKANLWLEKAENSSFEEALAAFRKAWELNPELTLAYVGAARMLLRSYSDDSDHPQYLEDKLAALKDAWGHLNRALAIDEGLAPAYGLRADVLAEISHAEEQISKQQNGENQEELQKKRSEYGEIILADLTRAIILEGPDRARLHSLRAEMYYRKALWGEDEESNYHQALADMNEAIAREKRAYELIGYYNLKGNILKDLSLYYQYYQGGGQERQARETEELARELFARADQLGKQEEERERRERKTWEDAQRAFATTEVGRLEQELNDGWKERVADFSLKHLDKMSAEEQQVKWGRLIARMQERVASGLAIAYEYLVLSEHAEKYTDQVLYLTRGVALLEKQNPQGREALLLVRFYGRQADRHRWQKQFPQALAVIDKALALTERHLPQALAFLPLNETLLFFQEAEKSSDLAALALRFAPTKEKAEALYWLHNYKSIIRQKASLLETLGLASRARTAYTYLCEKFQEEAACRDAARLR